MSDLLNPYQYTAVASLLRAFEQSLRETLRWLDGAGEQGYLYKKSLELPVERRTAALEQIEIALEEIRALSKNLGFEEKIENSAAEIRARMSIHWADLSGRHAADLKGFGQVNPDLASVLDPPLDRMARIAMELSRLFTQ